MNRRHFIKTSSKAGAALFLTSQLIGCSRKSKSESENELERELLSDFLEASDNPYVSKKEIENTLYDILEFDSKGNIIAEGRATHLGDNYFLTAHHVVSEETSNFRLIPQWRRSYVLDYHQDFEIVEHDEKSDLALLKTSRRDFKAKAKLHLDSKVPSLDEKISTFIRLTGRPSNKNYEFEYGGRDFYDESKKVANLGKLILPAQSLLLEIQGKVLKYDETYLNQKKGNHKGTSENEVFTSVLGFSGESGQPMFVRDDEDKYIFTGIVTGGYGLKHIIPIPNNPFGRKPIQQVGAFFAHRNPIEKLVKKYVKRISSPQR